MFTAKSRESPKTKAEGAPDRRKSKLETAGRVQANPLWHQLATRVQAKRTVGARDDPYEREADRIADQVLATPAHPGVSAGGIRAGQSDEKRGLSPISPNDMMSGQQIPQSQQSERSSAPPVRRCACGGIVGSDGECSACRAKRLSGQARSSGRPLEQPVRSEMEHRFGHDFSKVRIHADRDAEDAARSVNAAAFTIGQNISFSRGQYAPHTPAGSRLLAHELAHTVQQRNASAGSEISYSSHQTEAEAKSAAAAVARGEGATSLSPVPSLSLARQDTKEGGGSGGTTTSTPTYPSDEPVDTPAARQTACLIQRGNCKKLVGRGGLPVAGVMAMENLTCKRETTYTGPDVWPSETECKSPKLFTFDSIKFARSLATKYPGWLAALPNCPCTDAAAAASSDWAGPGACQPQYHPGAKTGYRSAKGYASVKETNHGQQCCYDDKGLLITAGAGAGTPDVVQAPAGALSAIGGTLAFWSDSPGLVAAAAHYQSDVVPFNELGWQIYNRYWMPNNGNNCPANTKP